jgi:hypothetical protein
MKNLNLKVTILINFIRCFFSTIFTSAIILFLMQVGLIKVHYLINLALCFNTFLIVFISLIAITSIQALFNAIPMIFYALVLPGYILTDVLLYFLIKANPIGYDYPIYTFAVYIPFEKI